MKSSVPRESTDIVHDVNVSPAGDQLPWYVVWAESRAEKRVAQRLEARGFDVWLPTTTQKRRWSDRWQEVSLPLFPGYLFASPGAVGYVPLLRIPGVLTLVKRGLAPAALSPAYVAQLKSVVENPAVAAEALPVGHSFVAGDEVLVRDGPLAGWRGTVTELRGARKLLVWVQGIGRGLLCTLGAADVVPAAATANVR
jgi:transcription antitermination factor NusG